MKSMTIDKLGKNNLMEVAISSLTGRTQAQVFRSKSRCLKTTKQHIDLAKSMNAKVTDLTDGTKLLTFFSLD